MVHGGHRVDEPPLAGVIVQMAGSVHLLICASIDLTGPGEAEAQICSRLASLYVAEHKSLFSLSTPAKQICLDIPGSSGSVDPNLWQGLEGWPEASGENTLTLHLARSWESFHCRAWVPSSVVPRGAQPASGYIWLHN